jgi:hypothetical protein
MHGGLHQPALAERREPFVELAGLLREGADENTIKVRHVAPRHRNSRPTTRVPRRSSWPPPHQLELYRSLRDANLVKCPE